jgi:hypothetical protein
MTAIDVYSNADSRGVFAAAAAARITSTPLHSCVTSNHGRICLCSSHRLMSGMRKQKNKA